MKFGTGSNAERTPKYGGSKYKMTYIRPNIYINKQTSSIFNCVTPVSVSMLGLHSNYCYMKLNYIHMSISYGNVLRGKRYFCIVPPVRAAAMTPHLLTMTMPLLARSVVVATTSLPPSCLSTSGLWALREPSTISSKNK